MVGTLYTTVKSGLQYYSASERFDPETREFNGLVIAQILRGFKWTDNAIAGILGNMQSESGCNPGAYYGYADYSATSFGLVQWDPTSKYEDWADERGYLPYHDIEYQCERIHYEFENGLQYSNRDYGDWIDYNITEKEFINSTDSPYYLACVFAWNYERSATVLYGTAEEKEKLRQARGGQANKWYELLGNLPYPNQPAKQKGLSKLLLYAVGSDII